MVVPPAPELAEESLPHEILFDVPVQSISVGVPTPPTPELAEESLPHEILFDVPVQSYQ